MIVNEARQLGEPSRRDHPVLDQAMVSVGKQLRPSARARGLRHGLQVSVRLRPRLEGMDRRDGPVFLTT
jgi:hypothetical protein